MKKTTRFWISGAACLLLATVALGLHAHVVLKPHARIADRLRTLPDVPLDGGAATRLPNGWRVTPAGRPIALPGDLPVGMAFTPDGKSLLVNTAGFHNHSLNMIDVAAETLTQSVDVGNDWTGMCLGPDGTQVTLSSGGTPTEKFRTRAAKTGASPALLESFAHPLLRLALLGGRLAPQTTRDIPGLAGKDRFIAGLASGPDGALYAANIDTDTVYRLGPADGEQPLSAKVGTRPYAVSLSPDAKMLAVSNWGAGSVCLLNPATLREVGRVLVGSHPNQLAWARDGRLFVACAGSNAVSVISGTQVVETIKTSLDPQALVGSTPDALALSPDERRLYVANADNNDVAVVDVSDAKESHVLGFIPTGWYPSALAVSPDGRKLFVGVGKGLTFRANANAGTRIISPETIDHYDYIPNCLSGVVSVVDVPSAARLKAYTQQVRANVPHPQATPDTPGALAAFHRIKHVLYIIRENRTYDEVFGDMSQGNGAPDLCLFGERITPNAHALASRYVLLDNLYCNGEVSQDGHPWCDAAYATDFTEKAWPLSYSGRAQPKDGAGMSESPAGYLWDNCARHGVSYYSYGECAEFHSDPDGPPVFTGLKTLAGHASPNFGRAGWFAGTRDTGRAAIFLKDLQTAEKTGVWPRFMVMDVPEDHTQGLLAGAYTPTADVAENDLALGQIVDAVSRSRFWPETAIFVIEDDAQDGPDHVDAHRTVGLVISPYVRHGVDSTMYTTASFVRTMEMILGLPPMTQYDAAATPLYSSFTDHPVLIAYRALPARVSLEARNPTKGAGAVASARVDLSAPDRADPGVLNAILWHELKPGQAFPPPVRSAGLLR